MGECTCRAVVAAGGPRDHLDIYRRDLHAAVSHRVIAGTGGMDARRCLGRSYSRRDFEPSVD